MQKVKTAKITCAHLFEEWMKYKAIFVDARTLGWYKCTLASLKRSGIAKMPVTLPKTETYSFLSQLKGTIAPETLKRRIESLEACWKWGIENDLVETNPWVGLARQIRVPKAPPPQPFTSEEIAKIISAFKASPYYSQLTPFVQFLFWTGCRTGEAIGLRWQDLSPDLSKVTIGSQYTRGTRKPAKCGKVRSFLLSSKAQQLLRELKCDRNPKPADLVFTWNDKAINDINFRRRCWKPLLEEVGVVYRTVYTTRHTFISHCLERGMNPATVAAITGHDVAVLFRHYAGSLHAPQAPEM